MNEILQQKKCFAQFFYQVASRISWQLTGVIFILAAIFGKVGGILALVPEPIVGGMLIVACGMIFSSAIAAMKNLNMEVSALRNLTFPLGWC